MPARYERVDDAGQHGGHHHGVGDALVGDTLHPAARIKRRELHDAAACVDRAEDRADPGDVIRRNADERGFVRVGAEELDRAEDVGR